MTPGAITQLAILVVFVLPASVYQVVRAHLVGQVAANRDLANRALRALAASVGLSGLYMIMFGPTVVQVVDAHRRDDHNRHWFVEHVRPASAPGLLLLFVIPTTLTYIAARRYAIGDWLSRARHYEPLNSSRARVLRRANRLPTRLAARCEARGGLRFDATPTAPDWAADHGGSTEGFVRVHTTSGWQGGMARSDSYFPAFPDKPAIFVQQAWQLDESGALVAP